MRLHWLLVLALVCVVKAKQTGAPDEICDQKPLTLEPGHGHKAKDGKSAPYMVTASANRYASDKDSISITIKGKSGSQFKGFAVAVKDATTDQPIGKWKSHDSAHANKCNVMTHNDNDDKSSITLTWNPPKGSSGSVRFLVTVVKELETYYTQVPVAVL